MLRGSCLILVHKVVNKCKCCYNHSTKLLQFPEICSSFCQIDLIWRQYTVYVTCMLNTIWIIRMCVTRKPWLHGDNMDLLGHTEKSQIIFSTQYIVSVQSMSLGNSPILESSCQKAKVYYYTKGLCSVNRQVKGAKGTNDSTGRKWQHEIWSVWDEKSRLLMYKSCHTIWVCEEITLKGISGQHAMKWGIVQLWINELDPHFPLLISDITELWLYEEQMATEQNNKAVCNQTELEWLDFYSIRVDPKMHIGKLKTDHTPRSLLAKKWT